MYGTRWRRAGEVKGKLANGVGSQYPSHYLGTWCIQHYYRWCAHLGCASSLLNWRLPADFISRKFYFHFCKLGVDSSWNVMAHGDAREGQWRGNWRMQWVASTLHTTSEHIVSSITTADAPPPAVPVVDCTDPPPPGRFKWTRTFCWKTKSGFCACAIAFQWCSTNMP